MASPPDAQSCRVALPSGGFSAPQRWALGAAAVLGLRAPPPLSDGEPSLYLPAPYGVYMGMPLDQAISLLEQQGFGEREARSFRERAYN